MPDQFAPTLIAVDIGNSRIKLGKFDRGTLTPPGALLEPSDTIDLPIDFRTGQFDENRLTAWTAKNAGENCLWLIASVHHAATGQFTSRITYLTAQQTSNWRIRRLTFMDIPMHIRVDEPARVGIDRLLASFAANRLRRPDRGAIVVDLGSAITVDQVDAEGGFAGGAILPGITLSARALAEQTDALPRVEMHELGRPPAPLGKSTVSAIESGLYWGAVGAIRELMRRLALNQETPPDVFVAGGASSLVAGLLAQSGTTDDESKRIAVRHVPHLVLSGIALVDSAIPEP